MKPFPRALLIFVLLPSFVFAQENKEAVGVAAPPPGWSAELEKYNTPAPVTAASASSSSSGEGGGAGGALVAMLPAIIGACTALGGKLFGAKNEENAQEMTDAMYDFVDRQGFSDYNDYTPDPKLGAHAAAYFGEACHQKYINKDGKLGVWGRLVLDEVRARPSSYADRVPEDITRVCPNYKYFNTAQRENFWVWSFMALAAPESSCNPAARNTGAPNGTAKGLYQLEKKACDPVGVAGNLYDPYVNIRCAVRVWGNEIQCRNHIMWHTSKGRCATYWGPLRTDDSNKARGGDVSAALKFRSLTYQFPGCRPTGR